MTENEIRDLLARARELTKKMNISVITPSSLRNRPIQQEAVIEMNKNREKPVQTTMKILKSRQSNTSKFHLRKFNAK